MTNSKKSVQDKHLELYNMSEQQYKIACANERDRITEIDKKQEVLGNRLNRLLGKGIKG